MRFTRIQDLLGLAAVVAVVSWLVIRQVYGDLPPLPAFVSLSLLALAVVEIALGLQLRARIARRPGTEPVQPLVAARAVALAKASSLVGAAATGFWAGLLAHTVPNLGFLAAAGDDTRTGVVGVLCGLTLVGGGLWLEHCCRTPDRPDDDEPARPA
ncbi:DUF3180 domain-containing protein [soil metagenome]